MIEKKLIRDYFELIENIKKDINGYDLDPNEKDFVYNFINKKVDKIKQLSSKFNDISIKFSELREEEEVEIYSLGLKVNLDKKYGRVNSVENNVLNFDKHNRELYASLEESAIELSNNLDLFASELEIRLEKNDIKTCLGMLDSMSKLYENEVSK